MKTIAVILSACLALGGCTFALGTACAWHADRYNERIDRGPVPLRGRPHRSVELAAAKGAGLGLLLDLATLVALIAASGPKT